LIGTTLQNRYRPDAELGQGSTAQSIARISLKHCQRSKKRALRLMRYTRGQCWRR